MKTEGYDFLTVLIVALTAFGLGAGFVFHVGSIETNYVEKFCSYQGLEYNSPNIGAGSDGYFMIGCEKIDGTEVKYHLKPENDVGDDQKVTFKNGYIQRTISYHDIVFPEEVKN